MSNLSEEARLNKIAYNMKRNKELTTVFAARLPKEEYNNLCEYLKKVGMNKAEFVRFAFEELKIKESLT